MKYFVVSDIHDHYALLKDAPINFVGNVEARDVPLGAVDVVVCDGFVGNMVIKLAEGLYSINSKISSPNSFWEGMNYEHIGGTPVLGINAPVVIGHGKSTPLAIKNMILSTEHAIASGLVENLKEAFK